MGINPNLNPKITSPTQLVNLEEEKNKNKIKKNINHREGIGIPLPFGLSWEESSSFSPTVHLPSICFNTIIGW